MTQEQQIQMMKIQGRQLDNQRIAYEAVKTNRCVSGKQASCSMEVFIWVPVDVRRDDEEYPGLQDNHQDEEQPFNENGYC